MRVSRNILFMNTLFQILVLVCLFTNCSENKGKLTVNAADEVAVYDTSRIALLPLDTSRYCCYDFSKGQNLFNLRPAELNTAELQLIRTIINECLGKYNSVQENIIQEEIRAFPGHDSEIRSILTIDLKNYRCQYMAFLHPNGDKETKVNCFRHPDPWGFNHKDWKHKIVHVSDGGNSCFSLYVNLTKRSSHDFHVNSNG
jgi:hypothetical protein